MCPELFWALRIQQRTKRPKIPVLLKHPSLPLKGPDTHQITTASEEGPPRTKEKMRTKKACERVGESLAGSFQQGGHGGHPEGRLMTTCRASLVSVNTPHSPASPPAPQDERPQPSTIGSLLSSQKPPQSLKRPLTQYLFTELQCSDHEKKWCSRGKF